MKSKRIKKTISILCMTGIMLLNTAPYAVYANVSEKPDSMP